MKIIMPFLPEFQHKMLNGEKTCTSRTRKYGTTGDIFHIFGEDFVIEFVEKKKLNEVKNTLYSQEGFDNPSKFREIWEYIHPRKGFDKNQIVYVHHFRRRF